MSEVKLDAAIRILREAYDEAVTLDMADVEVELLSAILILSDWPKWAKLIEAAGKVDRVAELATVEVASTIANGHTEVLASLDRIRALLSAIPQSRQEARHDDAIPAKENPKEKEG